jgi:acyl carrier protein
MPQSIQPLTQTVTRILFDRLNIEISEPDADLVDGGLLDSLLLVNLIAQLEREFGISVSRDDLDLNLEKFRSVNRIAAYIESQRNLIDVA